MYTQPKDNYTQVQFIQQVLHLIIYRTARFTTYNPIVDCFFSSISFIFSQYIKVSLSNEKIRLLSAWDIIKLNVIICKKYSRKTIFRQFSAAANWRYNNSIAYRFDCGAFLLIFFCFNVSPFLSIIRDGVRCACLH